MKMNNVLWKEKINTHHTMYAREIDNNIYKIKFEVRASCISYLSTNPHCWDSIKNEK